MVYRSTRGDLDEKFRVVDNTARDLLITLDLVDKGHIIYNESTSTHEYLKEYPTFGSLTGVLWEAAGTSQVKISSNDTTQGF